MALQAAGGLLGSLRRARDGGDRRAGADRRRKYLAADRLQIVAVGDPSRVAETLKTLGEVETYDTDGKRVGTF